MLFRNNAFDLFDDMFHDPFFTRSAQPAAPQIMKTDVEEKENGYVLDIELPGYAKEDVQAELKDKIGQSYRYYHDIKKINDIEMETLEGLIKTYEDYGGKNSFVHSLVQKEMYTWEHIDKI